MDKLIGLVFVLLGAGSLVLIQLTVEKPDLGLTLSPRFFPNLAAIGLLVFGLVLGIQSSRKERRFLTPGAIGMDRIQRRRVLLLIIITISYVLLLQPLGFIISTLLVLMLSMLTLGERNWKIISIASVLYTVACYFFFTKAFRIPFPSGIFY